MRTAAAGDHAALPREGVLPRIRLVQVGSGREHRSRRLLVAVPLAAPHLAPRLGPLRPRVQARRRVRGDGRDVDVCERVRGYTFVVLNRESISVSQNGFWSSLAAWIWAMACAPSVSVWYCPSSTISLPLLSMYEELYSTSGQDTTQRIRQRRVRRARSRWGCLDLQVLQVAYQ